MSTAIELLPSLQPLDADARDEKDFAERRARALKAVLGCGEIAAIGTAGDGVPYVILQAEVEPATHQCAPDCPCWSEAEEL